jgi:hypothetical protein
MALVRIETFSFSSDGEVLAWESASHDVNICWENDMSIALLQLD